MNHAKSMSLRARINNFSKLHGISPQLALQSFFAERFLARIAKSPYVGNLAPMRRSSCSLCRPPDEVSRKAVTKGYGELNGLGVA